MAPILKNATRKQSPRTSPIPTTTSQQQATGSASFSNGFPVYCTNTSNTNSNYDDYYESMNTSDEYMALSSSSQNRPKQFNTSLPPPSTTLPTPTPSKQSTTTAQTPPPPPPPPTPSSNQKPFKPTPALYTGCGNYQLTPLTSTPFKIHHIPHSHITLHDVLMGRGGGTNKHAGNVFYRNLIEGKKDMYCGSVKKDKLGISDWVVRCVRDQGGGGRFLKREDECDGGGKGGKKMGGEKDAEDKADANDIEIYYHDIGDLKAREKTSQCLREGQSVRFGKGLSDVKVGSSSNSSCDGGGGGGGGKSAVKEQKPKVCVQPKQRGIQPIQQQQQSIQQAQQTPSKGRLQSHSNDYSSSDDDDDHDNGDGDDCGYNFEHSHSTHDQNHQNHTQLHHNQNQNQHTHKHDHDDSCGGADNCSYNHQDDYGISDCKKACTERCNVIYQHLNQINRSQHDYDDNSNTNANTSEMNECEILQKEIKRQECIIKEQSRLLALRKGSSESASNSLSLSPSNTSNTADNDAENANEPDPGMPAHLLRSLSDSSRNAELRNYLQLYKKGCVSGSSSNGSGGGSSGIGCGAGLGGLGGLGSYNNNSSSGSHSYMNSSKCGSYGVCDYNNYTNNNDDTSTNDNNDNLSGSDTSKFETQKTTYPSSRNSSIRANTNSRFNEATYRNIICSQSSTLTNILKQSLDVLRDGSDSSVKVIVNDVTNHIYNSNCSLSSNCTSNSSSSSSSGSECLMNCTLAANTAYNCSSNGGSSSGCNYSNSNANSDCQSQSQGYNCTSAEPNQTLTLKQRVCNKMNESPGCSVSTSTSITSIQRVGSGGKSSEDVAKAMLDLINCSEK